MDIVKGSYLGFGRSDLYPKQIERHPKNLDQLNR